jgi:hypothetical protein
MRTLRRPSSCRRLLPQAGSFGQKYVTILVPVRIIVASSWAPSEWGLRSREPREGAWTVDVLGLWGGGISALSSPLFVCLSLLT